MAASAAGEAMQPSLLESQQVDPSVRAVAPLAPGKRRRRAVYGLLAALALCSLGALVVLLRTRAVSVDPAGVAPVFVPNDPTHPAPFFRVTATSPYHAGTEHGRLAQARIHAWFASGEMKSLFAWTQGAGSEAFAQLKRDNAAEFPTYVEEMRGIADGAGVTLDQVWCANMINDLGSLMSQKAAPAPPHDFTKGCSDVYAVSPSGYADGFAHGHTDDWSPEARKLFYFLSVSPAPGATDVDACAGVAYPASLVGWAPTWNEHGMYATQNTLTPRSSRPRGLVVALMQRRAICGAQNMDEAIAGLTRPGWSDGASMNVVDVRGGRMANVELWEDLHSVLEVTRSMANYSHFNEYKHLSTAAGTPVDDPRGFVHDARQGLVDSLPSPQSTADIMDRLSNPKVYNKAGTLVTLVLNGTTGEMNVWCCGVSAMSDPANPVYSFNLKHFF